MYKKIKKAILLALIMVLPIAFLLSSVYSNPQLSAAGTLTAYESSTALTIDGVADEAAWGNATALVITTAASGGSIPNTAITFKAVYTTTNIYILASWADTTFSASRDKYVWNGSEFVGVSGSDSEDRLAIMWEITNIAGFDTVGCTVKCHSPSAYLGTDELGDIWHLKAARGMGASSSTNSSVLTINATTFEATAGTINILGIADDNVIDETDRGGDAGTGPYRDNNNGSGAPAFIETAPTDWMDAMYLTEAEIGNGQAVNRSLITSQQDQWYIGNYTALGAVVPRHITGTGAGSRGDISTGAIWANGVWTVEIGRALDTTHDDDIKFSPNGGTYHFGVSLMDNSGGDDDHSTTEVAMLKIPSSATQPIPGFDLLIIVGSMFGAIALYVFYKKRRK